MTDQAFVLGLVWAVYLVARLGVEEVLRLTKVQRRLSARVRAGVSHAGSSHLQRWSPAPAALWLFREVVVAIMVVGAVWLVVRDATLPSLLPANAGAAPGDVRRFGFAVVLGWSLAVINIPAAWQLLGRLLPAEDDRPDKRVDPRMMGATIGVLERVLVIALIPGGGPAAVGFVVAAKTLARFRELNNKRFAERYLLGTMASVTIALASALAVQLIWAMPL